MDGSTGAGGLSLTAGSALILPLEGIHLTDYPSVLVILHAYHLDVAERMIFRLASLNAYKSDIPMRLVITTDTESKVGKIERMTARWPQCAPMGHVVEVHPNRGRNVAPFLAACRAHARAEDLILHLHTKKSPHAPELAGWGEYLFDCLAGSRDVVESVMAIMKDPKAGLIYPAHYRGIANIIIWGPNFAAARDVLRSLNVQITPSTPLEFPAGMMFWTRLAALQPLLDMHISHEDFEPEAGQTDGTLAHALERTMIYIVEASQHFAQPVLLSARTNDCWTESGHHD